MELLQKQLHAQTNLNSTRFCQLPQKTLSWQNLCKALAVWHTHTLRSTLLNQYDDVIEVLIDPKGNGY